MQTHTRSSAGFIAASGCLGILLGCLAFAGCAAPGGEETTGTDAGPTAPAESAPAGYFFPEGDATAGREVFLAMSCHSCHEVPGETFPAPVAQPPVPVPLDATVARKSREQLAEAILAPSHTIREGAADADLPELSRMGDYTETLTVAQLIDLVAYIQYLGTTV
jgi:hypothetical protein